MIIDYDGSLRMGVTSLATFHTCKVRWYLGSFLRFRLNRPDKYMTIGTYVHAALEEYYRNLLEYEDVRDVPDHELDANECNALEIMRRTMQTMRDEMNPVPTDIDEWEALAEAVVTNYFRYGNPVFFRRVLAVEQTTSVQENNVIIRGQPDLIVEMPDGQIHVVDHKCRGQKMDDSKDLLTVDMQMQLYAMLAEQLIGQMPDAVVHNVLLRKKPQIHIKKNGHLSVAATRITWTTADLMSDAVLDIQEELSEDEYDQYMTLAEDLAATTNERFFQREVVSVDQNAVVNSYKNAMMIAATAKDTVDRVHATGSNLYVTRNAGTFQCKRCPFLSFCAADLRGENAMAFLENDFTQRLE